MDFKDALHLGQGLLRLRDAGSDCLGTVHTGAASEADDGVAAVGQIHFQSFCHVGRGGIGNRLVVDTEGDTVLGQDVFQAFRESKIPDACIGDDQCMAALAFLKNVGNGLYTAYDFRFTVREKWERYF